MSESTPTLRVGRADGPQAGILRTNEQWCPHQAGWLGYSTVPYVIITYQLAASCGLV